MGMLIRVRSTATSGRVPPAKVVADPPIIGYVVNPANLCTLLGLVFALSAIILALHDLFSASITAALWALLCDWYDGVIARATGSTPAGRSFGAQLDALVDIVAFGLWPGLFLYALGGLSPWLLPGLFAVVLAGAVRLSYFGVHGLDTTGSRPRYVGLPMDYLTLFFGVVFAARSLMPHTLLLAILYGGLLTSSVLMVSAVRTPKLQGGWYGACTGLVVVLTTLFAAGL